MIYVIAIFVVLAFLPLIIRPHIASRSIEGMTHSIDFMETRAGNDGFAEDERYLRLHNDLVRLTQVMPMIVAGVIVIPGRSVRPKDDEEKYASDLLKDMPFVNLTLIRAWAWLQISHWFGSPYNLAILPKAILGFMFLSAIRLNAKAKTMPTVTPKPSNLTEIKRTAGWLNQHKQQIAC